MPTMSCVPAINAEDSCDVAEALEIARALWDKGERKDAIRWVRRAAEAADQADQTMRVVALARAAAELDEAAVVKPVIDSRPTERTSSVPPAPQSQTRVMASPNAPPRPSSLPPRASTLPPRPSALPPRPSAPPSARTPATIAIPTPASPIATSTPQPTPTPTPPAAFASQTSRPSPVPVAPRVSALAAGPVAPPAPKETRIRVSYRESMKEGDLLVVRLLPEGQSPPAGTREAYLVIPEE